MSTSSPLRPRERPVVDATSRERSAQDLVVASVPSGHVYVRHLAPEQGGRGVVRLPDPDPGDPDRPAGAVWWPPVMLDPEWAATAEFDLFHLHFGFDAVAPERLADLVEVLRDRRKPLVFTVHDLRNPHHTSPEQHDRHLDVLVPAADAVITLTQGAAEVIRCRWGREALVAPHPHVVDLAELDRRGERAAPGDAFRIGLHVKSLRPSMDPLRILSTLVSVAGELPGAVLQVNGHRDVLDPDGARRDPALASALHAAADLGLLELHVHDFLSDADLWDYLESLDVSVLPYRFGTHSGWLEACRDLGTRVVAPTCGFFAEQGPVLTYVHDEHTFDPGSLADALRTAYAERPAPRASAAFRREQRQQIAELHESLYRRLVAGACASA